jgi:hypothetical protein
LYARALLSGELYPGSIIAYGLGIYFSEASREKTKKFGDGFEDYSSTAWEYADKQHPGIILRAVINPAARV